MCKNPSERVSQNLLRINTNQMNSKYVCWTINNSPLLLANNKHALEKTRKDLISLPGSSTVKRYLGFFAVLPGYIQPTIKYLVHQSQNPSWSGRDFLCSFCFDEIHLTRHASFDTKLGSRVGPNKCSMVLTVRGLFSNWFYPLLSEFDYTLDLHKYLEIISLLYQFNYIVKWSVCDQG